MSPRKVWSCSPIVIGNFYVAYFATASGVTNTIECGL